MVITRHPDAHVSIDPAPADRGRPVHMPLLDPLRLALALCVVITHVAGQVKATEPMNYLTGGRIKLGDFAVDCFFIVSGLLIHQSWQMSDNIWHYLIKRVARIYPLFLVVSIACAWIVRGCRSASWLAISLGIPPEMLHGQALDTPAWTIRYEFGCYLGLAVLGVCGLLRRRDVLLGIAITSFVWYWAETYKLCVDPQSIDRGVIARFVLCFSLGACLNAFRGTIAPYFAWVAVAIAVLAVPLGWENQLWPLCAAFGIYRLTLWRGTYRFMRGQDLSYGVYLMHEPLVVILSAYLGRFWPLLGACVGLALLCAVMSWNLLEKPCLKAVKRILI